jgi:hypothetical protein
MLSKSEIRQAQINRAQNSQPEAADGAKPEAMDTKSGETTAT